MTLRGVLLGTAVGDALGLPWEGLSGEVVGRADPGDMLLLGGRGLLSDDTEQSVLVASAWAAGPDRFAATLRRSLRKWFLSLPFGIGFGTARALLLGRGVASAAPLGVLVPRDRLLDVDRPARDRGRAGGRARGISRGDSSACSRTRSSGSSSRWRSSPIWTRFSSRWTRAAS